MKLSPLQYALTSVGCKVDVTDQFKEAGRTSPFTKKALDKGTRIYCKPMPEHRIACATFGNLISAKAIYINSRKSSQHNKDHYYYEGVVEHESVHIDQTDLLKEVYGKQIHPFGFSLEDQFSLTILQEAEAYGYEFSKACADYTQTNNFDILEQCRNRIGFTMKPSLRTKNANSTQAQIEIDKMLTDRSQNEILRDFVLNFTQDAKTIKMINYSTHYGLATYLENSAEQNFFAYKNIMGFDNPAEQTFSEKFGIEHFRSYMKKGNREYYNVMDINQKVDFAVSVLDVSDINLEPYSKLVQQARSMRMS